MKEIHSFTVKKEKEIEVKKETEAGTLLTKEKQLVDCKIILKKPSRLDIETADEIWSVAWSDALNKGILSKAMVERIYKDKGGFISEEEKKEDADLYETLQLIENEKQLILFKGNLEEDKVKFQDLEEKSKTLYLKIQEIQNERNELFANTAEVRARNKTITWLVLNLTYIEEDGIPVNFFKGVSYENKMDYYFNLMESAEPSDKEILDKAAIFYTFWFLSKGGISKEDFINLEKEIV